MGRLDIRIVDARDEAALAPLVDRRVTDDPRLERRVRTIVTAVRRDGDDAVRRFGRQLDRLEGPLEVPMADLRAGAARVERPLAQAIRRAAVHIRRVGRAQLPRARRTQVMPGVVIEQRVLPLDRVGCYVPGGRYPLPSSLLMTAVPARLAGVGEIVAVCPRPTPAVYAAAIAAGVDRFFRIGGAHAIAALAYGTATIPRVDKIVGPGSTVVSIAKRLVAPDCPIDFTAGPSEILVVSTNGRPGWIAADLVAQAEHDVDARAWLLTPSRRLADAVARTIAEHAPAAGPARAALARHGAIVVTRSLDEAVDLANRIAPEHLVCDDAATAARVTSAGAVFVGPYAAQAAGDYATGSNHVLPTSGAARFRGGLSAADFVRVASVQRLTRQGLRALAPTALALADAEGLSAHAHSIRVRL
jgi:histidinol dehydrogenase